MSTPSHVKGTSLEGQYHKEGKKIIGSNGFDFLICSRKNQPTTRGKSPFFLLKVDQSSKSREYISSIYQKDSTTFEFDFQSIRYEARDEDGELIIAPCFDTSRAKLMSWNGLENLVFNIEQ
jgi:hypothetical protein